MSASSSNRSSWRADHAALSHHWLPVALAIVFAGERWRPWMLLLIMLPFWTNLLIRTYALMSVLRTEGYANFTSNGCGTSAAGRRPSLVCCRLASSRRCRSSTTTSPSSSGSSMCTCRSWCCRSMPARSDDSPSSRRASIWARVISHHVLDRDSAGASGHHLRHHHHIRSGAQHYLTPDLLGGPDSQMIANVIERQFRRPTTGRLVRRFPSS